MKCKTCREHGNFHLPRKQLPHMQTFGKPGAWKFPCALQRNICLGKVHGNFHVPWNETYCEVHGNFHVLSERNIWQGTRTFWYLAICFVARYLVSGIAKKCTEISLYQCILAAQRNMDISVDLHWCIKLVEHILQRSTLSLLSSLRLCVYSWQWQA